MVNDLIFKFLDPKGNTKLSILKGLDIQELIILLNNFLLIYRKFLSLESYITFGFEIEVENTDEVKVKKLIDKYYSKDGWKSGKDMSLSNGWEVKTPIFIDSIKNWKDLDCVCSLLYPISEIDESAGGHVHVGTHVLGNKPESWTNFLKLWSTYENIIFRFANGEYLNSRPSLMEYAEPVSKKLWDDLEFIKVKDPNSLSVILDTIDHGKYFSVCFDKVEKEKCDNFFINSTIEFRCPNGTIDPVVWQNYANLFIKILLYSKSSKFDDDIVSKRHDINSNIYDNLDWYNQIFLDQVLEFVDLVFNNNLDKVYFLRQYFKNMDVAPNNDKYYKAKKFTRTNYRR